MHVRPLAIAIGVSVALVAGACLLLGSRPRVDPIVPIAIADLPTAIGPRLRMVPPRPAPAPPGSFAQAQPCLIATLNCLELAPEPFAPCLLAVERCSGEWRLQPLLGRHPGPSR